GQQRLMHWLEGGKRLNRAIEFLPTDQEIAQRRARKQGLTAPENAVLMAYAKMAVFDELVASNLPDDPFYSRTLQAYFPQALRERFAQAMHAHPLKREIIATFITNTVINRTGATFVNFLAAESGAATADVIRAFTLAREIFDLEPLWDQIDALDYQVGSTLQLDLLHKLIAIAQRASRWMLRLRSSDQTDMPTLIQRYQGPARELRTHLADWLPAGAVQGWQQATATLAQAGVQEALAHNLTALDHSFPALDLVDLAQSTQSSLEQAARAYFGVEASLDLAQWRTQINRLPTDTLWQTQARASARDDVYSIAGHITQGLLQRHEDLGAWQDRNARSIERLQRLLATIHTQAPDLAPVSVALRELRHLA
ncbi:MAG: NAD-glutamate dehydrogenase, partial [Giesbergeria sp.]